MLVGEADKLINFSDKRPCICNKLVDEVNKRVGVTNMLVGEADEPINFSDKLPGETSKPSNQTNMPQKTK